MEPERLETLVRSLSRRRLTHRAALGRLAVGGGAVALASTVGLEQLAAARGAIPAPAPAPPPGPDLVEPQVLASQDGLLDVTLTARLGPATVNGKPVTTTVYNGIFPGPLLRIRPGDRLRVKLVNELDQITNLHTHGFHVSPLGNSDNVLLHVEPGNTIQLQFDTPDNHPPGLYWYHPHGHGESDGQVNGGMAGGIVNVGPFDELPGIAGLKERVLLIQASQFGPDGTVVPLADQKPTTITRFINGQVNPTIRIRPGETQRWRIGNISADTFVNLQLAGHQLNEIMSDANPKDQPVPQDQILLGPAERSEVLVVAGAAGSYQLKTLRCGRRGAGRTAGVSSAAPRPARRWRSPTSTSSASPAARWSKGGG